MVRRIFIAGDNIATFACPNCQKIGEVDIAALKHFDRAVTLMVKCPCGHSEVVFLERRKQERNLVDLPGRYFPMDRKGDQHARPITVLDVSIGGIKFKLNGDEPLEPGERLLLDFRLDDANQTRITKEVSVKKVSGPFVGTAYCAVDLSDPKDKALGSYLRT